MTNGLSPFQRLEGRLGAGDPPGAGEEVDTRPFLKQYGRHGRRPSSNERRGPGAGGEAWAWSPLDAGDEVRVRVSLERGVVLASFKRTHRGRTYMYCGARIFSI